MRIGILVFKCFALLAFAHGVSAQKNTHTLIFSPTFESKTFCLEHSAFNPNGSSDVTIEVLKFYISDIRFLRDDQVALTEPSSVHLLDASDPSSLIIEISTPKTLDFNTVTFNLGIDSTRNVSGALGGDLDPTNGMYWTWQNGYINFKLEGKSEMSQARNNAYQFHLGGYQFPYNSLKTIHLEVADTDTIYVDLDIENFLNEIDLSRLNHVMSPGSDALMLSSIISQSFSVREE